MAKKKREDVRADIRAAIDRLASGAPSNPDLIKRHLAGKLNLGPAAVSKESGTSRTLIGHANCQFPDLRLKALELKALSPIARRHKVMAENLSERIIELERIIRIKDSAIAALQMKLSSKADSGNATDNVRKFRTRKR